MSSPPPFQEYLRITQVKIFYDMSIYLLSLCLFLKYKSIIV